ncbi:MAG: hypothetical protein CMJ40_08945 [Phycisphaerae bacterium]|nr:hypothetical protein [Phycisphaerae bacterium]|tara:strand:+ start:1255 stop:1803 length:549 start_codon:yes stop_codon:yes gene_type:complete
MMDDVLVLDVETTGLSRRDDVITTACWYYKGEWNRWVRDVDSPDSLRSHWIDSDVLVTFNGRNFDEKFIIKDFGLQPHTNHRDVMHDGWRLGYKGGLKLVSESIGLPRPPEIQGMDGRAAITLWQSWSSGDHEALELLSLYNAWDVWLTRCLYQKFVLDMDPDSEHRIPWKLDPKSANRLLG